MQIWDKVDSIVVKKSQPVLHSSRDVVPLNIKNSSCRINNTYRSSLVSTAFNSD
jgi:hypothetical protein